MAYLVGPQDPEPRNLFEPILKFEADFDREAVKRCNKYFNKDDVYFEKMQAILYGYPHLGCPREPSQIIGHFYVGSTLNAENHALLRKMKITHVINCEGYRHEHKPLVSPYANSDTYVKDYTVLEAMDDEYYNIIKNFGLAFTFIDRAREKQGRVLVHSKGNNLASAIAIGYLIKSGVPLLLATKKVKDERRTTLNNIGFMKQLILYARARGLLDSDPTTIKTHKYGSAMDKRRIFSSHLPNVLGPRPY